MMNKNKLAYLKRKLLKTIKPDDEAWMKKMDARQRMALFYFYLNPSDYFYALYTVEEMRAGRDKLISDGVPLPSQLQGDWERRVWEKFGIEPPVETPSPSPRETVKQEEVAMPKEPRAEEKKESPYGNPFLNDRHGSLWGSEEEGIKPPLNKVKIY